MNKLSFNLTRGVNDRIAEDNKFSIFVLESLKRHFENDFSECSKEDGELNKAAIVDGGRIFNVFHFDESVKIWIITEAVPYM